MDIKLKLKSYWRDIATQNANALEGYFLSDAYIRWNNTNEHFTVQEFIIANCEYPGDWMGEVERIEILNRTAITVTRVWISDNSLSFHVTSFFEFKGEKIAVINEYWGDDGTPPQWRMDKTETTICDECGSAFLKVSSRMENVSIAIGMQRKVST